MTTETLAFDIGTDIVGILNLESNEYKPSRGNRKAIGAQRLIECSGVIVSFNGNGYDLPELAKLLGKATVQELGSLAQHLDMQEITSCVRWPPDPGKKTIAGQGLRNSYEYYFPDQKFPDPPSSVRNDYEKDNWQDCWMAGQLWRKLAGQASSTLRSQRIRSKTNEI